MKANDVLLKIKEDFKDSFFEDLIVLDDYISRICESFEKQKELQVKTEGHLLSAKKILRKYFKNNYCSTDEQ